jgi:hypothetical protein
MAAMKMNGLTLLVCVVLGALAGGISYYRERRRQAQKTQQPRPAIHRSRTNKRKGATVWE